MAKRKKHILTLENDFDIEIIGICSHHSDYRLAWSINEGIGLKLKKCDEDYLMTDRKGNVVSEHSMYEFNDEVNRMNFYMVKNKSKGQYLIHEKPTIDYFLFLCDNSAIDVDDLTSKLRNVKSILAAYSFLPDEMISVENIAFN